MLIILSTVVEHIGSSKQQIKVSSKNQGARVGAGFGGERPTLCAGLLFFLFSGPPSFRLRNPEDSLEGVIDPTVVLQISVWIVAGVWALYQFHKEFRGRQLSVRVPTV
jgi:hypothetical protein